MKKLYDEYFHVPENGKISDKVMIVRVVTTVIIMIACLAAMSISAYAYFSSNVISSSNVIKSANFDVVVTVEDGNENEIEKKGVDSKTYAYSLNSGTYTVTVAYDNANSTAETGFCIIEADGHTYHTQQIWENANKDEGRLVSISFKITLTQNTTVEFTPHWGTSSYYPDFGTILSDSDGNDNYVVDNETIVIGPIQYTGQPYDQEEPQASDTTTIPKVTMPSDNTGDVATSTLPTASDTTTSPEQTQPAIEPPETTTDTTVTEIIHKVVSGENLTKIANQYNTTVLRIVTYNGITDQNIIYKGQLLKIPPADWEIPEDTSEQT